MFKRAHIRRRQDSDDEDDNRPANNDDNNEHNSNDGADSGNVIEDLKLIQKLRQRKNGLSADELALGKQTNPLLPARKLDSSDGYKLKAGGLIEMSTLKEQQQQRNRPSKDLSTINDNFARETNRRDEDTEMQRYIEEQLAKLQQEKSSNSTTTTSSNNELQAVFATLKKPEDTLFHVSKHLITDHSTQASEEMLSEQMLSGIPEVDIGV
ncbi:unnamed protein product, partial [Adineta steineri]